MPQDLSTSTRGRELKRNYGIYSVFTDCRPPREVVSWKIVSMPLFTALVVDLHERSWVENPKLPAHFFIFFVDLHERSWVEKLKIEDGYKEPKSRPPREVVSWKIQFLNAHKKPDSRPPREVVSWKKDIPENKWKPISRPPREVVSWKNSTAFLCSYPFGRPPREVVSWKLRLKETHPKFHNVDLHERSWVEKQLRFHF